MNALHKRTIWLFLTLFLLPVLLFGLWYYRQVRQQNLDHALIEAIKQQDTKSAIVLLDEGANANAADKPYTPVTLNSVLIYFWNRLQGNAHPKEESYFPPALLLPYSLSDTQDFRINMLSGCFISVEPAEGEADTMPHENAELVKALLEHGADPSILHKDGWTILHLAAALNHSATVKVLLKHHTNPNIKNKADITPLLDAKEDCARLLIENGADVNVRDHYGNTPLMLPHRLPIYQLLLAHKAEVNAQDNVQNTVLTSQFRSNPISSDVIRLFIKNGAKVSLKDEYGNTAMDYARSKHEMGLVRLLEAALKKEQAEQHTAGTGTR